MTTVSISIFCDTLSTMPKIGDYCNLNNSKKELLLVSASQMWPAKCVFVNNIKFKIAVDNNNRINYIMTTDSAFHTPDNISMQCTLKELIDRFGDKLHAQPGFGWIFNLPSGWNACFVESSKSFGIKRPDSNKYISWISK